MNGLVARQALLEKALHCLANDSLIWKGKLILHDDMEHSMRKLIGNSDTRRAMKLFHEPNSLALIQCEPRI